MLPFGSSTTMHDAVFWLSSWTSRISSRFCRILWPNHLGVPLERRKRQLEARAVGAEAEVKHCGAHTNPSRRLGRSAAWRRLCSKRCEASALLFFGDTLCVELCLAQLNHTPTNARDLVPANRSLDVSGDLTADLRGEISKNLLERRRVGGADGIGANTAGNSTSRLCPKC